MISRTVRFQLIAFALITAVGVAYTGFTYVGIRSFFGLFNFAPNPYTVHAQFSDSGGIFTNAQVTERGVPVGRVGKLTLIQGGVVVDLKIDHGKKIPADVTALVANLSAVGEQYVDLTPLSDSKPYLGSKGHDVIPMSRTAVPIDNATLLKNLDALVSSVNRDHLKTVITELGTAFQGTGPDLQRLVTKGNSLLASAQSALPQTLRLIDNGKTVLNTQRAVSGDLQSFARNLNLFSQQLVTSDPDLRRLLDNGVAASQTLTGVLKDNEANLPIVLQNLVTLGRIQSARLPGLESILIAYPPVVGNGPLLTIPDPAGGPSATAQFGLINSTNPPVCFNGYQSTPITKNRKANEGKAANLNVLCLPKNNSSSSAAGNATPTEKGGTGSTQRGAQTAPRPPGDNTAQPGGAVGTSTNPSRSNYSLAAYNPATASFTVQGAQYSIGTAGQEAALFGSSSWGYLLAAGTFK